LDKLSAVKRHGLPPGLGGYAYYGI